MTNLQKIKQALNDEKSFREFIRTAPDDMPLIYRNGSPFEGEPSCICCEYLKSKNVDAFHVYPETVANYDGDNDHVDLNGFAMSASLSLLELSSEVLLKGATRPVVTMAELRQELQKKGLL